MNLVAIVAHAKKADACPYNSQAVYAYREAVATLQPDVFLAFLLAYQRYAFCRTAGAWESESVLDTLSPEEFDARVDQEIAARSAERVPASPDQESPLMPEPAAIISIVNADFPANSVPGEKA